MRKRLIGWMAFAIPFLVALSLCGASPGWMDASEFIAASRSLGLSHPPGHPAYLLLSHLFSMIPLGSIAFRLALFSAFLLGVASWLTYRVALLLIVLVRQKVALDWHERVIASLVVVSCSLTYTCLLQAVRPDVYTLHAALVMAMVERLLAAYCQMKGLQRSSTFSEAEPVASSEIFSTQTLNLEDDEPAESGVLSALDDEHMETKVADADPTRNKLWTPYFWRRGGRDLCLASFWGGIALTNHHYLTLLMVPGCLILLTAMSWRRLFRSYTLIAMFVFSFWALLTYTYLPMRSVSQPTVHWGEAFSIKGISWYVSAKAWQQSIHTKTQTQSFSRRIFLLSSIYVEQLGGLWLVLLFLGLYIVCRLSFVVGLTFLCWWGAGVLGRLVMVVDRYDADLHGHLVITMLLLACIIAALLTMFWEWLLVFGRRLSRRNDPRASTPRWAMLAGLLLVGGTMLLPWVRMSDALAVPGQYPFSLVHCDRSETWASLLWIELNEEPLPLQTLVFSSNYQTGFLRWYRKVVEHHRPDLQLFPQKLMGLKGFALIESHRNPAFYPLYLAFAEKKSNRFDVVNDFSSENSVCLEWYKEIPPSFSKKLSPSGSLFCWLPHSQRPTWKDGRASDDISIKEQQRYFWDTVYKLLKSSIDSDRELRKVLLWTHYQHAQFYGHSGRWASGLEEVQRALRLVPQSKMIMEMRRWFRKQLNTKH